MRALCPGVSCCCCCCRGEGCAGDGGCCNSCCSRCCCPPALACCACSAWSCTCRVWWYSESRCCQSSKPAPRAAPAGSGIAGTRTSPPGECTGPAACAGHMGQRHGVRQGGSGGSTRHGSKGARRRSPGAAAGRVAAAAAAAAAAARVHPSPRRAHPAPRRTFDPAGCRSPGSSGSGSNCSCWRCCCMSARHPATAEGPGWKGCPPASWPACAGGASCCGVVCCWCAVGCCWTTVCGTRLSEHMLHRAGYHGDKGGSRERAARAKTRLQKAAVVAGR